MPASDRRQTVSKTYSPLQHSGGNWYRRNNVKLADDVYKNILGLDGQFRQKETEADKETHKHTYTKTYTVHLVSVIHSQIKRPPWIFSTRTITNPNPPDEKINQLGKLQSSLLRLQYMQKPAVQQDPQSVRGSLPGFAVADVPFCRLRLQFRLHL